MRSKRSNLLALISCLLLYIILMGAAMLLPFEKMGVYMPSFLLGKAWVDDVIHFFAFIPWMFVAAVLFKSRLASFISGLLLVLSIEIVQMWIPCRGFAWADLCSGATGMICSYVLFMLICSSGHGRKYDA